MNGKALCDILQDFNWILFVIGVVYKCVVSYLASLGLGRVEAKSPKYKSKPLPKIKNYAWRITVSLVVVRLLVDK